MCMKYKCQNGVLYHRNLYTLNHMLTVLEVIGTDVYIVLKQCACRYNFTIFHLHQSKFALTVQNL